MVLSGGFPPCAARKPKAPSSVVSAVCCAQARWLKPALRRLELGTPLQMLRHWRGDDGRDWIQVQMSSGQGLPVGFQPVRGWVRG